MTTYPVMCLYCGREMLFEQPAPMDDPGELSAFCSNDCSRGYGKRLLQQFVDLGSVMVDMDCGCFAVVHSVKGNGATMPWMICEKARGRNNWSLHSNEVHHAAVQIVRERLEQENADGF